MLLTRSYQRSKAHRNAFLIICGWFPRSLLRYPTSVSESIFFSFLFIDLLFLLFSSHIFSLLLLLFSFFCIIIIFLLTFHFFLVLSLNFSYSLFSHFLFSLSFVLRFSCLLLPLPFCLHYLCADKVEGGRSRERTYVQYFILCEHARIKIDGEKI